MFKTIKEEIALATRTFKAAKEYKSRLVHFYKFKKVQGFKVLVYNDMLHQFGMSYAAAFLLADGEQVICVDDDFFKLPSHVQLFILHHENGHIQRGHLTGPHAKTMTFRRHYVNFFHGIVTEEMEADEYAYNQVGTVTALLASDYIRQHLLFGSARKEMNRRYHLLGSYAFTRGEVRLNKECPDCGKEMPLGICTPCTDRYFDETAFSTNRSIQNLVKGEN